MTRQMKVLSLGTLLSIGGALMTISASADEVSY